MFHLNSIHQSLGKNPTEKTPFSKSSFSSAVSLQKRDSILLLEWIRLSLLVFLFCVLMVKFFSQAHFVNTDRFFPIYFVLSFSFFVHSLYLIWFERLFQSRNINRFLFFYEIVMISFMAYFFRVNPSIYLFMYLVNLFFCGFILGRRQTFLFSCLTSLFFHIVLLFFSSVSEGTFLFLVLMNNVAFFFSANVSGYFGAEMDLMTKQIRERGKSLFDLKNLNQIIVQNIHSGLMTVTQEGDILYANAMAEKIFSTSNLKGQKLEKNLPELYDLLKDLTSSSSFTSYSYEVSKSLSFSEKGKGLDAPFNEKRFIEVRVSSFFDLSQKVRACLFLIQDQTEKKRLETLLKQKEKMAAIGQLASGIAHEIRNPLAGISGSLQMMFEDKKKDQQIQDVFLSEENRKLSQIVLKEIHRLNELVSEFLNYAKLEDYPLTPLDLRQVIEEVLEGIKSDPCLSAGVKKNIHVNEKLMILGNHNKLKQVFLNLFFNAFQALEGTLSPVLKVSSQVDKKRNEICVEIFDNGKGVDKKALEHIFEPFYTTKDQGTGLGLSLVYKIVEEHRGRIQVESQVGEGTSVFLHFPLAGHSIS